jgi:3-hydroxybutyryl-CoA dehydratase
VTAYTVDELAVGHVERLEVDVTGDDVSAFAALSGDRSPLHVDEAFARQRGFPGRVAHGLLIGAYVSRLVGTRLPGRFGVLQSCELDFRAPLVPPDRIEVTGTVARVSAGTGQITIDVAVRDSAGRLLASGRMRSLVRPGP